MIDRIQPRVTVVTGCDKDYFPYMADMLRSLHDNVNCSRYSLVILDCGLDKSQVKTLLTEFCADIIAPEWPFLPPNGKSDRKYLSYAARMFLPEIVPETDVIFWIDADIWFQDGLFFDEYIETAIRGDAAIAEEGYSTYPVSARLLKWHYGNFLNGFSLSNSILGMISTPVNAGIFAIKYNSPIWKAWRDIYLYAVKRTGKIGLDQHALIVALNINGSRKRIDPRFNWICGRSYPLWSPEEKVFTRPGAPEDRLSVLHLTGHSKEKIVLVNVIDGGRAEVSLRYRPTHRPHRQ